MLSQTPEPEVDVLIIGAGPAGLVSALWMSRLGIKTRIVDKRGTKVFAGQADGFQARSLEMLDSFGIADRVWKESNHMIEICLWNPDESGKIRRSDRIPDSIVGLSRYTQVVLHQGRIERFILDSIHEHSDIRVERGVLPEKLELDELRAKDDDAYPITVTLRHLSEEEATPAQNLSNLADGLFRSNLAKDDNDDLVQKSQGRAGTSEVVKAKYVIGCDGAHSWTRRQIGFSMEGEQTDFIWGVLDVIPITNFPDIRMRCAIHSENSGSVMVIPRENKLVRLYIQLTEVPQDGGRVNRSSITPEMILKAAQKIMSPYKFEYEYCDWWTAYQIGQRVGSQFSKNDRIFLAGDAVHTHSPKAGQGMNVSMQDAYNLGWKIGLVVNKIMKRSILKTYESERRQIAQDLIAFDHKFSRLFSGKPAKNLMDETGVSMKEFKDAFTKGHMFASGIAVEYGPSSLVVKQLEVDGSHLKLDSSTTAGAKWGETHNGQPTGKAIETNKDTHNITSKQDLATNIKSGMRFPSFQVLNQSDARPWHFQQKLPSDGRFRIIVFAGDVSHSEQMSQVNKLGSYLSTDLLPKYTPSGSKIDSVIEVLVLHSAPREKIELLDLHEVYHPLDKKLGWDYDKVYVDGPSYYEGVGEAYKNYGVRKELGCVVVARPDQYVGWIGELEDGRDLETYFEGVLIRKQ
jgi:phenol 2-monooxygenase